MFANGYKKIYSYHLRKCGGTYLNHWISRHVSDYNNWNEKLYLDGFHEGRNSFKEYCRSALDAFRTCEAVFTHVPLKALAPSDTFCLVVLREPISRIVSQVADWRRHRNTTNLAQPDIIKNAISDASNLNLREFLNAYAFGPISYLFDNYQTRAVARKLPKPDIFSPDATEDVLRLSLNILKQDYDLVGIQEYSDLVRLAISYRLGLPFDLEEGQRLNVTNSTEVMRDEIDDAYDILYDITKLDRCIYNESREIFFCKHYPEATEYSEEYFDLNFANQAVSRLNPHVENGEYFFSAREPLIMTGVHGRDAAGTDNCTVWSGSSSKFVIYMPVPDKTLITIKLWIRGASDPNMINKLSVFVDDKKKEYSVSSAPGWASIVSVTADTRRAFVKLSIDVGETLAFTDKPDHVDSRKRGLAFGGYSWTPVTTLPDLGPS